MMTKKMTMTSKLFLLLISFAIISCSNEGQIIIKKNPLVGTWISGNLNVTEYINDELYYQMDRTQTEMRLRFEEDYTGEITNDDEPLPFTYTHPGTYINLSIIETDGDIIEESIAVAELTEDKLVLKYESVDESNGNVIKKIQLLTMNKQ